MKNVLLGFSLVSLLSFVSATALAEPMYGVLMVVKGSVKVKGANNQVTDAKVGGKVLEGDSVVTGADSRAKIVMSDRNVINVSPDTEVAITKYQNDAASGKKNVEMNLLKGKVRNNVEQAYDGEKSKFLIKTPTAVAGVRGTQFLAGFNPQTQMTSVVTFKGAVTFSSVGAKGNIVGTPVMVKKGQMTQAAANKPPEPPRAVPKDEMKKLDGESTASMKSKDGKDASASGEGAREIASESPSGPMGPETFNPEGPGPEMPIPGVTPPPPPPAPVSTPIVPPNTKTKVNVRPVPTN